MRREPFRGRGPAPARARRVVAWAIGGAALAGAVLGAVLFPDRGARGTVPVRLLAGPRADGETVLAVTFNLRHALGVDGRLDLERVAETLRGLEPDILGLQEVDVFQLRSGLVNQPVRLAGRLGYRVYFGPAFRRGLGLYGNALLSRHPILAARTETLPTEGEPRSAIVARVRLPGGDATVVVTHLSLSPAERERQLAALAGLLRGEAPPYLLLGDWNDPAPAWPARLGLRAAPASGPGLAATFRWGGLAGDRIYVSRGWKVLREGVARAGASDHFPVWAELILLRLWG